MNRIPYCILWCIFMCGLPLQVIAGSSSSGFNLGNAILTVTRLCILPAGAAYSFESIFVEREGVLQIGQGSVINIIGEIQVDGTLLVQGTAELPIIYTSNSQWKGLYISKISQSTHLSYMHVLRSVEGMHVDAPTAVLSHIYLEDNIQNVIQVGNGESTGDIAAVYGAEFRNRLLGDQMRGNGVIVEGHYGTVLLDDIHIRDSRPHLNGATVGFRFDGNYGTLQISGMQLPRNCPVEFGEIIPRHHVIISFDPLRCPPNVTLS